MNVEKIIWGKAGSCLRVTSGGCELVVSLEFGPRVLFCGFTGGENMFCVFKEQLEERKPDRCWRSYGGHRFWHAPERAGRTYYPDNAPVEYGMTGGILRLVSPAESGNQMVKEVLISGAESGFEVVHRTVNAGPWPVRFSPWALSVMAPGSEAILPQESFVPHGLGPGQTLLPARPLVLWPFTKMADERFTWGNKSIRVRESGGSGCKLKIGAGNRVGWAACRNAGGIFVKRTPWIDAAEYPDMGCSIEIYTEPGMLELETLGPLTTLEPGATVDHCESWQLFRTAPAWLAEVLE